MSKVFQVLLLAVVAILAAGCRNSVNDKTPENTRNGASSATPVVTASSPAATPLPQAKTDAAATPAGSTEADSNTADKAMPPAAAKKLRYLFAANGGMIGYYDDGSVVGCPRCDLLQENLAAMVKTKPMGSYKAFKTYLLVDGKSREELYDEDGNLLRDWAIVDYKKIADF